MGQGGLEIALFVWMAISYGCLMEKECGEFVRCIKTLRCLGGLFGRISSGVNFEIDYY